MYHLPLLSLFPSHEGTLNWKQWPPPKSQGVCPGGHLLHSNFLFFSLLRGHLFLLLKQRTYKNKKGFTEPYPYAFWEYSKYIPSVNLVRNSTCKIAIKISIWKVIEKDVKKSRYKDLDSRTSYLFLLTTKRSSYIPWPTKHMNACAQHLPCRVYTIEHKQV